MAVAVMEAVPEMIAEPVRQELYATPPSASPRSLLPPPPPPHSVQESRNAMLGAKLSCLERAGCASVASCFSCVGSCCCCCCCYCAPPPLADGNDPEEHVSLYLKREWALYRPFVVPDVANQARTDFSVDASRIRVVRIDLPVTSASGAGRLHETLYNTTEILDSESIFDLYHMLFPKTGAEILGVHPRELFPRPISGLEYIQLITTSALDFVSDVTYISFSTFAYPGLRYLGLFFLFSQFLAFLVLDFEKARNILVWVLFVDDLFHTISAWLRLDKFAFRLIHLVLVAICYDIWLPAMQVVCFTLGSDRCSNASSAAYTLSSASDGIQDGPPSSSGRGLYDVGLGTSVAVQIGSIGGTVRDAFKARITILWDWLCDLASRGLRVLTAAVVGILCPWRRPSLPPPPPPPPSPSRPPAALADSRHQCPLVQSPGDREAVCDVCGQQGAGFYSCGEHSWDVCAGCYDGQVHESEAESGPPPHEEYRKTYPLCFCLSVPMCEFLYASSLVLFDLARMAYWGPVGAMGLLLLGALVGPLDLLHLVCRFLAGCTKAGAMGKNYELVGILTEAEHKPEKRLGFITIEWSQTTDVAHNYAPKSDFANRVVLSFDERRFPLVEEDSAEARRPGKILRTEQSLRSVVEMFARDAGASDASDIEATINTPQYLKEAERQQYEYVFPFPPTFFQLFMSLATVVREIGICKVPSYLRLRLRHLRDDVVCYRWEVASGDPHTGAAYLFTNYVVYPVLVLMVYVSVTVFILFGGCAGFLALVAYSCLVLPLVYAVLVVGHALLFAAECVACVVASVLLCFSFWLSFVAGAVLLAPLMVATSAAVLALQLVLEAATTVVYFALVFLFIFCAVNFKLFGFPVVGNTFLSSVRLQDSADDRKVRRDVRAMIRGIPAVIATDDYPLTAGEDVSKAENQENLFPGQNKNKEQEESIQAFNRAVLSELAFETLPQVLLAIVNQSLVWRKGTVASGDLGFFLFQVLTSFYIIFKELWPYFVHGFGFLGGINRYGTHDKRDGRYYYPPHPQKGRPTVKEYLHRINNMDHRHLGELQVLSFHNKYLDLFFYSGCALLFVGVIATILIGSALANVTVALPVAASLVTFNFLLYVGGIVLVDICIFRKDTDPTSNNKQLSVKALLSLSFMALPFFFAAIFVSLAIEKQRPPDTVQVLVPAVLSAFPQLPSSMPTIAPHALRRLAMAPAAAHAKSEPSASFHPNTFGRRLDATSDSTALCDWYSTMPAAGNMAKLTNWCGSGDKSGVCGAAGTSSWLGVTCGVVGGASRVTRLDLWTSIGGSLPTSIGGLDALTFLRVEFAGISGSIPSSLGALTGLTYLGLSFNSLSGSIPSSLGGLTGLTYLDLWYNRLSGSIPSSLGGLTRLTYLNLFSNALSGSIPSSLGGLTGLTYLRLGINSLSGSIPSSLGGLTGLTYLNLFSNALTGPVPASFCSLKPSINLYVTSNPGLTCYPSCLSSNSEFMTGYSGKDASLSECIPTPQSTPRPTLRPSPAPSARPTSTSGPTAPSARPSPLPTPSPTPRPSAMPTPTPSPEPSPSPTRTPTLPIPTPLPSPSPTNPTPQPTPAPSYAFQYLQISFGVTGLLPAASLSDTANAQIKSCLALSLAVDADNVIAIAFTAGDAAASRANVDRQLTSSVKVMATFDVPTASAASTISSSLSSFATSFAASFLAASGASVSVASLASLVLAPTPMPSPSPSSLPTPFPTPAPTAYDVVTVFGYTGGAQSYTVPAWVGVLQIEACGGRGASASGGYIEAVVPVTPGAVLSVYVGGSGASGGYNGGGAGAANTGGGTDVRLSDGTKLVAAAGSGSSGGVGGSSFYAAPTAIVASSQSGDVRCSSDGALAIKTLALMPAFQAKITHVYPKNASFLSLGWAAAVFLIPAALGLTYLVSQVMRLGAGSSLGAGCLFLLPLLCLAVLLVVSGVRETYAESAASVQLAFTVLGAVGVSAYILVAVFNAAACVTSDDLCEGTLQFIGGLGIFTGGSVYVKPVWLCVAVVMAGAGGFTPWSVVGGAVAVLVQSFSSIVLTPLVLSPVLYNQGAEELSFFSAFWDLFAIIQASVIIALRDGLLATPPVLLLLPTILFAGLAGVGLSTYEYFNFRSDAQAYERKSGTIALTVAASYAQQLLAETARQVGQADGGPGGPVAGHL